MTKGLGNFEDNTFQLDLTTLASKMMTSCSRDVRVSYGNTSITMNSVLLSLFLMFFFNSFTCEFADSNVRNFEFADQFPGVSEHSFNRFFELFQCQSIEFNISNILDFFQLSVYFLVDDLKFASKHFLETNSLREADLVYLLKISNERNQLNFVDENIQIFKVLYDLSENPIPLRISFIVFLFPFIDLNWLLHCLMELYDTQGLSATDFSLVLNSSTTSEYDFDDVFQILERLFNDSDFTATFLEWSLELFKGNDHFGNIPPCWFLGILLKVDRYQHFFKQLNFL
ncbi:hypothetical protein GEMRC1_001062 [Eukaryota sp. GEM-RC1]